MRVSGRNGGRQAEEKIHYVMYEGLLLFANWKHWCVQFFFCLDINLSISLGEKTSLKIPDNK